MKTLLIIFFVTLGAIGLDAAPPASKLPPETELVGEIRRITTEGIVVKGTIEAPGETWDGTYVLIGYPKQDTTATGDTLQRVVGRRTENVKVGTATLRAYQFVRTGSL